MKFLIAIILSIFVLGCPKKNDPAQTTTTTTGYQLSNGLCYSTSTGQQVATGLCTTTTNGYQLSNGICYSTSTGQQVATGFCTSTNSGYYSNNGYCYMSSTGQQVNNSFCSTSTTTSGQCIGVYIYNGQYVQCNGADCRGYTLIQATTNTTVTCQ